MDPHTYGVKYIGSKASLIPYILKAVPEDVKSAIDVFTGTTRVAQAFKQRGIVTTTSDLSWAASAYSGAWICNEGPNTHLQACVDELNKLPGTNGWITTNYCDVRAEDNGLVRVWQVKNGRKADSIRDCIERWKTDGEIQPWEADTLTTSLILALDKVDNTVGVQQAYLKDWCKRSFNDLTLELPPMIEGPKGNNLSGDCLELKYEPADLAYLDPPYSSHSYASYYHIWDSITAWDKPEVGLKTNRRVDRIAKNEAFDPHMVSQWNSKKGALKAFETLIKRLPVKSVLVSYNNESLVEIASLLKLFRTFPSVEVHQIDYKRNVMCQIGNAAKDKTDETVFRTTNTEFLFLIRKA